MTEINQQEVQTLIKPLESNRFDPVEYVDKAADAAKMVLDMIPPEAKVGMGGSTSRLE